jgi:hypothetical protein
MMEAQLLLEDGKFAEAEAAYAKVLENNSDQAAPHIGLADAKVGKDDIEGARLVIDAALEPTQNSQRILDKIDEIATPATTAVMATPGEPPPPSALPIDFREPALERMLLETLGKPEGTRLTEIDLAEITSLKILGATHAAVDESLISTNSTDGYTIDGTKYTERGDIRSLYDFKHFRNLNKLTIGYNEISELTGIEELKGLRTLGLYCNEISDLSPLAGLEELDFLYLYNNQISDLQPLAGLSGLQELWLNNNAVASLEPLSTATGMERLIVSGNQITDISPLASMKTLFILHADDNQITDLTALAEIPVLEDLSLINNPVEDFSPVEGVLSVKR